MNSLGSPHRVLGWCAVLLAGACDGEPTPAPTPAQAAATGSAEAPASVATPSVAATGAAAAVPAAAGPATSSSVAAPATPAAAPTVAAPAASARPTTEAELPAWIDARRIQIRTLEGAATDGTRVATEVVRELRQIHGEILAVDREAKAAGWSTTELSALLGTYYDAWGAVRSIESAAEDAALQRSLAAAEAPEIVVAPWSSAPLTVTWATQPPPPSGLVFEPKIDAGVVGRAGEAWWQLGPGGALVEVTFDRAPTPPLLGRWPDDAWTVESRTKKIDVDMPEIVELRLMKLRGDRWVPQAVGTEQWWHPGTGDDVPMPHISTYTGMLVHSGKLDDIERIAGRVEAPLLGPCRGKPVAIVETHKGKVYVMSADERHTYAQVECLDEDCVRAQSRRFPEGSWVFGDRVARGKFSVSIAVRNGDAPHLLHNVGKSDGWRLEELPAGEALAGMWASDEGGLWTWNGSALRWRDTDAGWHDIALPDGFTAGSVAMGGDRKTVWVAGEGRGGPELITVAANAPH